MTKSNILKTENETDKLSKSKTM